VNALPPEPADGTALYWRARAADELAFCIIRDDAAGRLFRDGTANWFKPNVVHEPDPATWAQVQYWLTEELLDPDEATVLRSASGESP
jgi:hypothetical protein